MVIYLLLLRVFCILDTDLQLLFSHNIIFFILQPPTQFGVGVYGLDSISPSSALIALASLD